MDDQASIAPPGRASWLLRAYRLLSPRYWALVAVEVGLVVLLLDARGNVFSANPRDHALQMISRGLLGLAGWALVLYRPTVLPRALAMAPLPLFAAVVISAVVSPFPTLSWPATWQVAVYAGIFWLLAFQASRPAGRRSLQVVIAVVLAIVLGSFMIAVARVWRQWLHLGYPLTSLPLRPANLGGLAQIPTYLADLVVLATPPTVALLWTFRARIPAAVVAVVVLVAVVVTGTRSVLVFAAVVAVAAVLLIVRGRAGRTIVSVAITGLIALTILGTIVLFTTTRSLDEGRSSAYASAIARVVEFPLLGGGPGTYPIWRMQDDVDVIEHLVFPEAHNIVLNTVAESGLLGLVGLLSTVGLLGIAIRGAWRTAPGERLVIAGALGGAAVFAAHGMVDVVFSLVGITLVAIAVVALAATSPVTAATVDRPQPARPQPVRLRAVLGVGFLAVVLVSVGVVRAEVTRQTVQLADTALGSSPAGALVLARDATTSAPDFGPGWWVQMLAADADGDPAGAIAAAHRLVALEGFRQEWISLAVLAARQGDRATELDAVARATAGSPVDPLVELNAMVLLDAAGDRAGAEAAAGRLVNAEPDIEGIIRGGPAAMAADVAAVRADVAAGFLAASDPDSALIVALSGEDRALADSLVARIAAGDPADAVTWRAVVDAWFGDAAARGVVDASARRTRSLPGSMWAWRLAGRACDAAGLTFWQSALRIGFSVYPSTPTTLGVAPGLTAAVYPARYPIAAWRVGNPVHPYVAGTWTYASGRPACPVPGG